MGDDVNAVTQSDLQVNLLKCRDLLAKGFCKNYMALDERGVSCDGHNEHAVKWCAWGAIEAVVGRNDDMQRPLLDAVRNQLPVPFRRDFDIYAVVDFNNHADTTQADVVALFERAAR